MASPKQDVKSDHIIGKERARFRSSITRAAMVPLISQVSVAPIQSASIALVCHSNALVAPLDSAADSWIFSTMGPYF